MKYFGTDGIRGNAVNTFTQNLLKKIGKAICLFYKKHNLKPVLLVGNDGRCSCHHILSGLCSVLLNHGVEVHNVGLCSTPCLAHIGNKFNYPLTIMITASHNQNYDNGIKFFSCGQKLESHLQAEIEQFMDKPLKQKIVYAKLQSCEHLKETYVNYLLKLKHNNFPCILDGANGGASAILKQVFPLNKKFNVNPNGTNINLNSGSTCIEVLQAECRKHKITGFAFDGDADRIIAVSPNGNVVDGDQILFILSKILLHTGDNCIGTIISNYGLEKSLKKQNINFIRTKIGDRFIVQEMKKKGANLGGEQCGHIIINPLTKTSDGVLTAIVLTNILSSTNLSLDELLFDYFPHHQATKNLPLNKPLIDHENLKLLNKKFENEQAKMIITPSGTENILRLFVEHKNKEKAEKTLKKLENFIKNM